MTGMADDKKPELVKWAEKLAANDAKLGPPVRGTNHAVNDGLTPFRAQARDRIRRARRT
jgi:hypothetical protein